MITTTVLEKKRSNCNSNSNWKIIINLNREREFIDKIVTDMSTNQTPDSATVSGRDYEGIHLTSADLAYSRPSVLNIRHQLIVITECLVMHVI